MQVADDDEDVGAVFDLASQAAHAHHLEICRFAEPSAPSGPRPRRPARRGLVPASGQGYVTPRIQPLRETVNLLQVAPGHLQRQLRQVVLQLTSRELLRVGKVDM